MSPPLSLASGPPTSRRETARVSWPWIVTAAMAALGLAFGSVGLFPKIGDIQTRTETKESLSVVRGEFRDGLSAIRAETERNVSALREINGQDHASMKETLSEIKADVRAIIRRNVREDR